MSYTPPQRTPPGTPPRTPLGTPLGTPRTPRQRFYERLRLSSPSSLCSTPRRIEKDNHPLNDSSLSFASSRNASPLPQYSPVQTGSPLREHYLPEMRRFPKSASSQEIFICDLCSDDTYSELSSMMPDHISAGVSRTQRGSDFLFLHFEDLQKTNFSVLKLMSIMFEARCFTKDDIKNKLSEIYKGFPVFVQWEPGDNNSIEDEKVVHAECFLECFKKEDVAPNSDFYLSLVRKTE